MHDIVIITILIIAVSFAAGLCSSYRWKSKKLTAVLFFILPEAAGMTVLFLERTSVMHIVKGEIFFLLLLYGAYSDIKSREVDDYIHIMLAITAFIGMETPNQIISSIVSGLILVLPMIFTLLICKKASLGGADIKLTFASGMILGVIKGMGGLLLGLLSGIVITVILRGIHHKSEEKSFPLIPYLTAGFATAYLI